ncbi:thioredoxin domain-containing protein [Nitriliruptoraceae bacterium ZYF776]|nr:thioredoxin domain-containing protein [Profundirhabdus halotolerans]
MNKNVRISAALVAVVLLGLAVAGWATSTSETNRTGAADEASGEVPVVRENSHRLSAADDGRVTLVEFLDFECEACAAAYPLVEELREDYGDQVMFVARYFPLPGHPNSETAAIAVEAAAQQGAFEAMYQRMFETQESWSHREQSQADVFRGFADEFGLDLDAYDRAVDDPATLERIEVDRQDGLALGVEGTPTFFLNGERLVPESVEQFRAAIEAEIGD